MRGAGGRCRRRRPWRRRRRRRGRSPPCSPWRGAAARRRRQQQAPQFGISPPARLGRAAGEGGWGGRLGKTYRDEISVISATLQKREEVLEGRREDGGKKGTISMTPGRYPFGRYASGSDGAHPSQLAGHHQSVDNPHNRPPPLAQRPRRRSHRVQSRTKKKVKLMCCNLVAGSRNSSCSRFHHVCHANRTISSH